MHPQIYCVQSHQCFSASRVLDSRRVELRWWLFYCLCGILPHFPVHLLLYQKFLQAQSTAPHPRGVLCCPSSASIPRLDFSLTFCSCCATLSLGESSNIPSGDLFVVTVGEDSSFFQNVLIHHRNDPAIRGQLPAMFLVDISTLFCYTGVGNELDVSSKATKVIRCTYCRKFIFILHMNCSVLRKVTQHGLYIDLYIPNNLLLWNIFFCIPLDKFQQFCYFDGGRLTRVLSLSCFVSRGPC